MADFLVFHGHVAQIETFQHPDALLEAAHAAPFDLYLLDVVMPMVNGVATAREIRSFQDNATIVFLTSSKDYAVEAFGVQARGYILKPWTRREFDEALTPVFASIEKPANDAVTLKTADGICRLLSSRILYVSASQMANVKSIHMVDGQVLDVRTTLESLLELLPKSHPFFVDGRYALVNPYHVSSIAGTTVKFDNGATLEIHHKSVPALRKMVISLAW